MILFAAPALRAEPDVSSMLLARPDRNFPAPARCGGAAATANRIWGCARTQPGELPLFLSRDLAKRPNTPFLTKVKGQLGERGAFLSFRIVELPSFAQPTAEKSLKQKFQSDL